MTVVRWEDPPPVEYPGIDHTPIFLAVKERPGEWALVREGVSLKVAQTTRSQLGKRGCDVTRRKVGEGRFNVYARWPVTP